MAKRKTKDTKLPLLLMILGSVIIFAVVIWQTSKVLSAEQNPQTNANNPTAEYPYPGVARINVEDAKASVDAGTGVIVDVRDSESFRAGHIAGAVNIPYDELTARLDELDPTKLIITYCT